MHFELRRASRELNSLTCISPEQLRQRKAICDELGRYLVSVRAAGSWAKWQLQRHKPFVTMLEKCLPDNIPTEVTAVVVAFWVHACDYC